MLSKHLSYNQNSFIHTYNNGRIEGINNQINVLIISKYSRH
nr:transposase [Amphibacillus xylanus]